MNEYSARIGDPTERKPTTKPFLTGTHKAVRSTGKNICGGILPETDTGGGEQMKSHFVLMRTCLCREPKVKLTAALLNTLF